MDEITQGRMTRNETHQSGSETVANQGPDLGLIWVHTEVIPNDVLRGHIDVLFAHAIRFVMRENLSCHMSGHLVVEQDECRVQRWIGLLVEFLGHIAEAHIQQTRGPCHRIDLLCQDSLHIVQFLVSALDLFFGPVDGIDLLADKGEAERKEAEGQTMSGALITGYEFIGKSEVMPSIDVVFGLSVSGSVDIFSMLLVLLCLNLGRGLEQGGFSRFEFITGLQPILVDSRHGFEVPRENKVMR